MRRKTFVRFGLSVFVIWLLTIVSSFDIRISSFSRGFWRLRYIFDDDLSLSGDVFVEHGANLVRGYSLNLGQLLVHVLGVPINNGRFTDRARFPVRSLQLTEFAGQILVLRLVQFVF